jgi:hypothetical protein
VCASGFPADDTKRSDSGVALAACSGDQLMAGGHCAGAPGMMDTMTMPTSDADRYAQLRQNLAVGLDAIRAAIETAFGVTLPTASKLNAEFEIITSAIYAAADQPRPVPVVDDKPTTRTHFVYRIDILTDDAKNILEHLAGMENIIVARAAYRAACERWPNARITLRQGARVVEDSRGRRG